MLRSIWVNSPNSRLGSIYLSLVIFILACVLSAVASPYSFTPGNIANLLTQAAPLCIAAMGQALVIMTGGLDISLGSVISLTTAIVALPGNSFITVPSAIGCAVLIGYINGLGVARFKVHPIIMTLSTMSVAQGAAFLLRPIPGGTVPDWLTVIVQHSVGGIPFALVWILAAVAVGILILHRSRFGLHLFATGGSVENARLNGVKTERVIIVTYITCSLFACAAGVFLAGRLSSGDPKIGSVFSLDSVTAVALGGISLAGGIGSAVGAIIGSLLLSIIGNTMNLMSISAFVQSVVKGLLLLVVVTVQRRKHIGL